MTHRTSRIVRFGLGFAAAGTILAAGLAPVLAQAQPSVAVSVSAAAQTSTAQATTAQSTTAQMTTAETTTAQTTSDLTLGQTQTLTIAQTEGPYFKTNSPERTSLVADGMPGTVLTLTGQVLAQDGTPVANALVDFWQASATGAYDNSGYDLRGHQYTDANGQYTLTTVVPGLYPGRTRHIHVKVQAPNSSVLTTQLYFAGEARNTTDGIFDPSLVLTPQDQPDGTQTATFNFIITTA